MIRNLLPFVICLCIGFSGAAVTTTWTNGNSNNLWNDAANWSSGIPGTGDIAQFNATSTANCTINTSVDVQGITILSTYSGSIVQGSGNTVTIGSSNFSQAAGSFVGGNSNIDINGTFNLSGGSFTATSATMTVGGTFSGSTTIFTHSSGTFISNNGTVEFDPYRNSCSNTTYTLDVTDVTFFYNVELNGTQSCGKSAIFTTAGLDSVTATNDFTHTNGYLDGAWKVNNDLYVGSSADGGLGSMVFYSTSPQLYEVASISGRTCLVVVDKPSSNVNPSPVTSDFSMQGFFLLKGEFTAPTGTMLIGGTFSSNATLFSHSTGAFNHNSGTVEFDPYRNSCSNTTYTIDVLTSTAFYDVEFDGSQSCGKSAIFATNGSDTLEATNDFTQTDGYLDGLFELKNDLIIGASADGGLGTIILNGTSAQEYNVSSSAVRTCIIRVDKASGALTAAGGTTDFSMQGFQLIQGSFTAPSGTMTIGGTFNGNSTLFDHTGGSFDANGGVVELDPYRNSCSTTDYTVNVLPSTEFFDLELNGSQSCGKSAVFTTGAGDTVNAVNDFIQSDGYIEGLWEVKNDLFLGASADGGLGMIMMNGTAAQEYDVASSAARTCIVQINKSSGAVTAAGGTTDFSMQGFELVQGSFTAPSGTMLIGGTFSSDATLFNHTGGTFVNNNGLLHLDPYRNSCSTTDYTLNVLTSTEFYNLELDGSQSCGKSAVFTTGSGDTVNVTNDFTQTDGYINGLWEVKNDFYLGASADGGLGMVIFNGTGDQEYNIASSSARTCIIQVDKASGNVTPAGGTTDFSMQGFDLMAGSFTAPSGTMNIGGTYSSNSTLFSHIGGSFNHNSGLLELEPYRNSCSNTTYTIDVLTSTEFHDVEINGSQSCGKSAIFSTAGTDTVNATNDLIQTNGYVDGNWEVKNDLFLGASADGGLGYIIFNGASDQEYDVASSAVRSCIIMVDKASGSVEPAAGTTDFSMQGFELLAGDFVAPTGTLSIGGTYNGNTTLFTHTGGSFDANSGLVLLEPYRNSCTYTTYTLNVHTSTEFNDLQLEGSQSCGRYPRYSTGTDSVHVNNLLTLDNGQIFTGFLEAFGDVDVLSTFDGGSGTLIFTGNAVQQFDLSGATNRFDGDILLNKTNLLDSVVLQSDLVLDQSGQTFIATRGVIHSYPTRTVFFGNGALASQDSGYIEGFCYKAGSNAFLFPSGRSGVAAYLSISAPGSVTDTFRAQYFDNNPNDDSYTTASYESGLEVVSTIEYWILDRVNGSATPTVTLSWRPSSIVSVLGDLRVARWDAGDSEWKNEGNTLTTGTASTGSVRSSNVSDFSPFTLGSSSTSNVLPIELVWFRALRVNQDVEVSWVTSAEVNNDYFEVERSLNGEEWLSVLAVEGAGNSSTRIEYLELDFNAPSVDLYYRLVQRDFDGTTSRSNTAFVPAQNQSQEAPKTISVIPNPVQKGSQVRVMIDNFQGQKLLLVLRDISGKEYYAKITYVESAQVFEVVDVSSTIPAGSYIITATSDNSMYAVKLVIQ